MAPSPTDARFPAIAPGAGHYESWYLKLGHPSEPLGVWIRYTIHKRPGAAPTGSLWFTLFDGAADGPRAYKETLPEPSAGDGDWVRVGESRIGDGGADGHAGDALWKLRFESSEPPLWHLPREWMYKAKLPRTKTLSPLPAARFEGQVTVAGRELDVDGWRGMVGHNWGAEHAERWIWMHGIGFDGAGEHTWIDAAIGRIKIGPATTPWIGNGAISIDGERYPLGGIERTRRTEVRESPVRAEFVLPGKDLTVQGTLGAARKDFVGWVYADPDGGEHNTVNCSIADMTLSVSRPGEPPLSLQLSGGAAYELGMRETDHGMPIQPYPDG
jgi:hypothetical protein